MDTNKQSSKSKSRLEPSKVATPAKKPTSLIEKILMFLSPMLILLSTINVWMALEQSFLLSFFHLVVLFTFVMYAVKLWGVINNE